MKQFPPIDQWSAYIQRCEACDVLTFGSVEDISTIFIKCPQCEGSMKWIAAGGHAENEFAFLMMRASGRYALANARGDNYPTLVKSGGRFNAYWIKGRDPKTT